MASTTSYDRATAGLIAERAGDPGWLADRRLEAFDRFESLPWPDPSAEAWRYSSLDGFDLAATTPLGERAGDWSREKAELFVWSNHPIGPESSAGIAVHVDGDVVHCSLGDDASSGGVVLTTLSAAAAEHPELVKDFLGSAGVPASDEKFAALTAAFASAGTFLYVPRGVEVAAPIHVFRWISAAGRGVFPRTLVVADEGAAVTVIEHLRCNRLGAEALCAATAEIHAKQASNVSYLSVQDWAPSVWHFASARAVVDRDATVRSLAATLGGRFSRSVVESILAGPGGYSEMLGVYFGDSNQHFDHRSLQEHAAPNARSELYYKGALKGHARAVYSGLIHIAKEAQGTDSWQGNRNLILSDHAKADSIPYLEIEANDVRCAHGASVGPPDEDVLFYLRSRGLDAREAERLVVKGFFQEVLDRVRVVEVRDALARAVEAELELEE